MDGTTFALRTARLPLPRFLTDAEVESHLSTSAALSSAATAGALNMPSASCSMVMRSSNLVLSATQRDMTARVLPRAWRIAAAPNVSMKHVKACRFGELASQSPHPCGAATANGVEGWRVDRDTCHRNDVGTLRQHL